MPLVLPFLTLLLALTQDPAAPDAPRAAEASPAEKLAVALVEARDEAARQPLMEEAARSWSNELEQALVAQATAREDAGRWADAAQVHALLLALGEQRKDKVVMAEALRDLGYGAAELNDYAAAAGYQQRALVLAEELGDEVGQFKSHNNLGVAYSDLGDLQRSLLHYKRAAELAGDGPYLVAILTNLGAVYWDLGDMRAARAVLERAVERAEQTPEPWDAGEPLNNLGGVYAELKEYDKSLDCFRRFLKIAEESGARNREALALNNIGNILRVLERFKEAREHLEKSARIAEQISDTWTQLLDYKDLGQLCLAERRLEEALGYGERCTAVARQTRNLDVLWVCRAVEATAARVLGRADVAHAAYDEVVEITEDLSARAAGSPEQLARFFEDKTAAYYGKVMLLVDAGRPAEALAWAERLKGRVLLEVLRSGKSDLSALLSPAERDEEERLAAAIVERNDRVMTARAQPDATALAAARAELEKARLEHEGFRTVLEAKHPRLRVRRGELRLPSPAETLALLGENAALVEYAVWVEAVYAFVIARPASGEPRVEVVRLDTHREALQAEVAAFRKELAARSPGYRAAARRLYDLLVRPLEPLVGGASGRSLVIVPDGTLWELPFQALVRDRQHLLELRALSYAPSLGVLAEVTRRAQPEPGTGLLAIGDPAAGPAVAPLPETRAEIRALAPLYAPSLVYTGADAREDIWKREAPRASVLHLATHGVLDDESPLYSHLVLAKGVASTEDGLLEAREIVELDLRAELAVLSACETGRGHVGRGEGVVGMSWAFFVAGCPATVVSHWKVDSASTTRLMRELHKALTAPGETTKAEALRSAALKLLRSGPSRHPFYWAGFSVVGSNAPLRGR